MVAALGMRFVQEIVWIVAMTMMGVSNISYELEAMRSWTVHVGKQMPVGRCPIVSQFG